MVEFDHKSFLSSLTQRPGVYQMLDAGGDVLYVGKAKNLKKRVSSYFRRNLEHTKTRALVARIAEIQVTVTGSETEALLLEQNLIKALKPPYNILFRDDKSYAEIFITSNRRYPAIGLHRGAHRKQVSYYGPFPSGLAVRQTLQLLQKAFKVRQCDDSYFSNRTRPCLQYQINRCSGPCVGLVSDQDYSDAVRHTRMFLEGKNREIIQELTLKMDAAAAELKYELAGELRDQLIHLRKIQDQQHISGGSGDVDIIAGIREPVGNCVQVLFVRGGRVLGSRSHFPKTGIEATAVELLEAFLPQFYLAGNSKHSIPREVIVNTELTQRNAIQQALVQTAGHKVKISTRVRGERARWLQLAENNARQNLSGNHARKMDHNARVRALQETLGLESPIKRMECFDISHSSGEATVASCVVFDANGPLNSDYRRFNITGITAGDDYAAMGQALERRYRRLQKEQGKLPDILFIDGGKGQLRIAEETLAQLGVETVMLVGVAKGTTRKPGLESLFIAGQSGEIVLPGDSPALHLVQHIRDEAHRFAIAAHRSTRAKTRRTSGLETIPGVGPKRRRELLRYFGGMQEVLSAGESDIARVDGISQQMAKTIYEHLHND